MLVNPINPKNPLLAHSIGNLGTWSLVMIIKLAGMALLGTFFQQPQVEEWPLNTSKFQIPIRIQQERKNDIKELVLYVSKDRGKTWEISSRALPSQEAFTHYAKEDGNYWFSVVIVDHKGNQEPREVHAGTVGQKVAVDTQKPEISMKVEKQGEEIRVKWSAKDANLDLKSMKLDCKIEGNDGNEWLPISIKPAAEGTGTFKVQGGGGITVRMQVTDLAGNYTSIIEDIGDKKAESLVAVPAAKNSQIPPMEPFKGNPTQDKSVFTPVPKTGSIDGNEEKLSIPPVATNKPAPFSVPVTAPGAFEVNSGIPNPIPAMPVSRSTNTTSDAGMTTPTQPIPSWSNGLANSQPNQVLASSAGNSFSGAPATPVTGATKRVLPQLQIISKKQVKIDYEVAKFGPSGLGTVDVYSTTDDGQSWNLVHTESPSVTDSRSALPLRTSIQVPVNQESVTTGFYLVVKSKAGLGKAPPAKGDIPQIRVEVDTTFPEATLFGPQPEPGQRDSLVLTWKASDKNLAHNPITLEWSEKKDGTWNPIGPAELPNTGKFVWNVPANIPHSVYLRLTVRDAAQNVAVAQTQEPLLIDLNVPEVNVLGINNGSR